MINKLIYQAIVRAAKPMKGTGRVAWSWLVRAVLSARYYLCRALSAGVREGVSQGHVGKGAQAEGTACAKALKQEHA